MIGSVARILKTFAKLLLRRGVHASYSQGGEDLVVQDMLRGKRGTYVDVGAYHPMLYSNTYGLYRRGWSGVVVDPNKDLKVLYRIFRPRDQFVHAGVALTKDAKTYFRFDDGAYNTFSPEEATKRKEMKHVSFVGEESIMLRPLADVVRETGIRKIDLMSIDVEGLDLEVLKSHDWNVPPTVVAVEDVTFNPDEPAASAIYRFLRERGYRLHGLTSLTLIFKYDTAP